MTNTLGLSDGSPNPSHPPTARPGLDAPLEVEDTISRSTDRAVTPLPCSASLQSTPRLTLNLQDGRKMRGPADVVRNSYPILSSLVAFGLGADGCRRSRILAQVAADGELGCRMVSSVRSCFVVVGLPASELGAGSDVNIVSLDSSSRNRPTTRSLGASAMPATPVPLTGAIHHGSRDNRIGYFEAHISGSCGWWSRPSDWSPTSSARRPAWLG
jgi:hypothetical protein